MATKVCFCYNFLDDLEKRKMKKRAYISVFNKEGIEVSAKKLEDLDYEYSARNFLDMIGFCMK